MDDIRISDSEWTVMKVLWHKGADGMTMKEIDEAVREHGWSYTTVRTMVGRLTEKGKFHILSCWCRGKVSQGGSKGSYGQTLRWLGKADVLISC